ncbi:lysozyme [Dyella sp. SG562]|uniref:lysozyme n=1 Tax=Dyella sp. SG562 TaxID=2587017 RepID=UPI00141FDC0C|nr:lysozyme [Dyella sp. SG562]NII73927.1 lysozyme [Dyella sp. SG562]
MQPSQDAYNLVKASEGLRLDAYPDPASGGAPWTIGYGHTAGVRKGDSITEDKANDLLGEDLSIAAAEVSRLVMVPLTQGQFDALCDFVFNLGAANLASSTLLRVLNKKDYSGAAVQFKFWVMAGGKAMPGLIKRRAAEKALFEKAA